MNRCFAIRIFCAFSALTPCFALSAKSQTAGITSIPANGAAGINPDTHLVLTFSAPPTLGKSGQIRIYDAADHQLVDTLDMSIPAGPDPSHRVTTAAPARGANAGRAPAPAATAARAQPADLHNYQLTTVGGLADFHFYPVIIHGNVATIYPHNDVLHYQHKYNVQIDPAVFSLAAGAFPGFTGDTAWTFTTKAAPPAAGTLRVVVAADGSGDFNTVEGAIEFVPDAPAQRTTIFIKNGNYEELVFFRNKANVSIRGEDRAKVQIGYGNNSAFNPPMSGPSRRCAFSAYNSTGIELSNFSVSNYYTGQAEGLLVSGSKNIVSQVNVKGSGDALNLRGTVYLTDSSIIGDGDTILGVGPAFFNHCELQSAGAFMWIRNTDANHGNVFLDCTFTARQRSGPARAGQSPAANSPAAAPAAPARPTGAVLARLPNNHGLNYPYAEAVLINCRLKGIPAIGWGPIDDDTSHLHLWEYNSTDADGHPIDITQRHPVSRQLTLPQDAQTIANYSNPAFVLGGWKPVVDQ